MSCDNVITVQDLETDKKHSTFYREVITGKAGGTGDDIDSATNAVTGQTQATLPKVLSNVGFSPSGFDFTTGGTLTERDKAIFYQPDGNWYSWGGTLPKVVPPASSPASTGGIADNAWNVSTSAFMYRDWEGFTAELLAQGGVPDNGQPDELGNSKRVDAIRAISYSETADDGTISMVGATDNSGYQRTLHLVGDSHTYGQGARCDTGPYSIGTHATRYGATTWSTMIKNSLYSDWRSEPSQYAASLGSPSKKNSITMVSALPEKPIISVSNFEHPDKSLFSISDRFDTSVFNKFSYNASQGFYSKNVAFYPYTIDSVRGVECATSYSFATSGQTNVDPSNRFGEKSVQCIDGVSRTRLFVTASSSVNGISQGGVMFVQTIGSSYKTDFEAPVMCVCEHIETIGSLKLYYFSLAKGTCPTSAGLQAAFTPSTRFKLYPSIAPKVKIPISTPRSLIGLDLLGGYCGIDAVITLTSGDALSDTERTLNGDWVYSASTSNSQGIALTILTKSSDSNMVGLPSSAYAFASPSGIDKQSLTIKTSDVVFGSEAYCDIPIWLFYGVKVTGCLTITGSKPVKYTQAPDGFNLGVRGVIDTDMTKICTHGFGCHSVGDWIGLTADICNHDSGVPFDHVPLMIKCEEIKSAKNRMAIIQAPMVNEALRQTPIATYKQNLTTFFNSLFEGNAGANKRCIIFTGAGEIGHDDYLGPVTNNRPITYKMYRDATREWAETMGVSYIDAAKKQKHLIDSGKAVGTDFIMLNQNGSFDSNHPNMQAHKLWFDAIYPLASRIFQ